MLNPESLHGRYVGRAFICADWELRAADRCVTDDLGRPSGTSLEDMHNVEIVKSFVEKRRDRDYDTGKLEPLTSGVEVWILRRGNDHRGATWHDTHEEVIWLLAYRLHRSGQADDFFPWAKQLDKDDRLLPVAADYATMFKERDERFVQALLVEVPLILHEARETPGEHRKRLGGDFFACISVEVDDEIGGEAIYIAFKVETVDFRRVPVILAVFHPVADDWALTSALSSRSADPDEVVYTCTREIRSAPEA